MAGPSPAPKKHQITTVLFTDIKDYTVKTNTLSRRDLEEVLKRHREVVQPVIEAHYGRVVEEIGDAFLAVFDSPTNAVLAGIKIHEAVHQYNQSCEEDKFHLALRAAVNTGEVTFEGDRVIGEAVNLASRLQAVAEAGDVYFTESTFLLMNKSEVPTSEVGYKQFKGIPQKIKVYKVVREIPEMASTGSVLSQPSPRTGIGSALLAGFFQRGIALLLDWGMVFFLWIVVQILLKVTIRFDGVETTHSSNFSWIFFFLAVKAWEIGFMKARKGTTLGKSLMKIHVSRRDGRPLAWKDVILRQMVSLISLGTLGLGYLWAAWDKEKRTWHDHVAGTLVILDIR